MVERCIYCDASILYHLADGRVRCSRCRRRFSRRKIEKIDRAILLFCEEKSALEASREGGLSYPFVIQRFMEFRKLIALFSEECFAKRTTIVEFDEYLYLDHAKRGRKDTIFDAHNILTFDYSDGVYSIMMPSVKRFKQTLIDDGADSVYYREFSRFMTFNRVARLKTLENRVTDFWRFLDRFMKKYKGVERERFFYYLKEAEFIFNYPSKEDRQRILRRLWIDTNRTQSLPFR